MLRKVTQRDFRAAAGETGRVAYVYPATFTTGNCYTRTQEHVLSVFILKLAGVLDRNEIDRLLREVWVTRLQKRCGCSLL
jgi:hypothetical protein